MLRSLDPYSMEGNSALNSCLCYEVTITFMKIYFKKLSTLFDIVSRTFITALVITAKKTPNKYAIIKNWLNNL